jgi:hypothetical protein
MLTRDRGRATPCIGRAAGHSLALSPNDPETVRELDSVAPIVAPVFSLALLGYLAARLGWFPEGAAEGLARFVFDFAVPLMLVRVLGRAQLPEVLPWQPLASFYLPAALAYAVGMQVSRRLFRRDFMNSVISGFCCSFGNSVLLGLPLALLAFGEPGMLPFLLLISVHGLSYFTVTTALLEYGRHQDRSRRQLAVGVLVGLVTNPIVLGLAVGVALNRSHLVLPESLDQILAYMQQAVTPCALFSLGASLSRHRVAGRLGESLFTVVVKILLMPAAAGALAGPVFGLPVPWVTAVMLLAAQPTGVNAWLFAERYAVGRELATTSVLLSTTASLGTISALLLLFERLA